MTFTNTPRTTQRERLRWAASVLGIVGLVCMFYGAARAKTPDPSPECRFALGNVVTRATVVSLERRRLVVDTGDCRARYAIGAGSVLGHDVAAGTAVIVSHTPGVLRGSRVLLRAETTGSPGSPRDH